MTTIVECDWSPSGQNFVKNRKQSLQLVSNSTMDSPLPSKVPPNKTETTKKVSHNTKGDKGIDYFLMFPVYCFCLRSSDYVCYI